MTCIVAIVERGRVHMGADSCVSDESCMVSTARPKLVAYGRCLMGWAGTVAHGQIVEAWFRRHPVDARALRGLALIDSLRAHVKKRLSNDTFDASCLVGVDGTIFEIDPAFGLTEHADGYAAIGNGAPPARGALFASHGSGAPAKQRIQIALAASERFAFGVRAPFIFATT